MRRYSFALLARALPSPFERREIVLEPGEHRLYDPADWPDALVVIERGRIELEWNDGSCHAFDEGDLLVLHPLQLRALRNNRRDRAVLVILSRRMD